MVSAALVIALAACGDSSEGPTVGSSPEPEETVGRVATSFASPARTTTDLAGVWIERFALMVRFGRSGTFAIDDGGDLYDTPAAFGTFVPHETDTKFRTGRNRTICPPHDRWAWRIRVSNAGELKAVVTEDASGTCRVGVGKQFRFTRVSPPSPAAAQMTVGLTAEGGAAPTSIKDLGGYWLRDGGAHLLHIDGDGRYRLDDTGDHLRDTGRVQVDPGGSITLVSAPNSPTCANGARMTIEGVRLARVVVPDRHPIGGPRVTSALRGALRGDPCNGLTQGEQTWFRLFP